MSTKTGEEPERERMRKITVSVTEDLHARLLIARIYARKPLYQVVEEALELIVAHYRAQRGAARRNEGER